LLFFADRHNHLVSKVWPAMEIGQWVLSDRFADSTFAYQYYGHQGRVSKKNLDALYEIAVGDFKPDLTIILDIDPKIGLARSLKKAAGEEIKEVRFESIDIDFHYRLREGFLKIANNDPHRCVVLDANKPIDELHKDIVALVSARFDI